MTKKTIIKLAVNFTLIAILIIAMCIGNAIAWRSEQEISSMLSAPVLQKEAFEASSEKGQEVSKRIMEEGAVLLKNENGTLPLDKNSVSKVNVFGWRSTDWIYGSEGRNASGGVTPEDDDFTKNIDLLKALNNYGVQYNKRLYDMYCDFVQPDHQSANLRGAYISELTPLREPFITDRKYYTEDLLKYSKEFSDTALVVIGRMAGEGMECDSEKQIKKGPNAMNDTTRHYLEISQEEEALLKYCGENYENVIVIINAANAFECGFLDTIPGVDACLYVGFTGTRGAASVPKLLYGEVSPSGRTVDTFPYDMFTNPGNIFLSKRYSTSGSRSVDIVENIYVGYKWYETAFIEGVWDDVDNGYGTGYDGVVQFPFGYGKSYNDYSWEVTEVSVEDGGDITDATKIDITVKVTNNGKVPGRDVVEAYVTVPYYGTEEDPGIEKAYVSLVGFNKTEILAPGESGEVKITVDAYDFASYDCYDRNKNGNTGYELEAGEYSLKLMTDCHNVKMLGEKGDTEAEFKFNVKETINIKNDPVTGNPVDNLFTGEDAVDIVPIDAKSKDGSFDPEIPWFSRSSFPKPEEFEALNAARACTPGVEGRFECDEEMMTAWDNAEKDEFGNDIDNSAVTWGVNKNLKLYENGKITELGKKLGESYDAEEWEEVLNQITMAEVADVISLYYGSKEVKSVGKPLLIDLDGPSQIKGFSAAPRGTGYPTMMLIASTWNPNLAYEFGKAYGDDMKGVGVMGVWGFAMDTHRSAFFGRCHESPSEDAMLAGRMMANAVKGLNTRGRYCFLKHFAMYGMGAGQQQWITEQGLREIYLKPFRIAVTEGGALGMMTSYSGFGAKRIESSVGLLTGVLRNEWGFDGAITTDYIGGDWLADAILRAGGNFGMGVSLTAKYDASSAPRVQHRMRDCIHQVLYTWLHADYNETQYLLNPDAGDNTIISAYINSWSWWQPLLITIDVAVSVVCAMWAALILISVFMKSDGDKVEPSATE